MFSVTAFVLALGLMQVIIELTPDFAIAGTPVLSFVGSSVVAATALFVAVFLRAVSVRRIGKSLDAMRLEWLTEPLESPMPALLFGAIGGCWSFVLVNAIGGRIKAPLSPFSTENPFSNVLSPTLLAVSLVTLAVFGLMAWILTKRITWTRRVMTRFRSDLTFTIAKQKKPPR